MKRVPHRASEIGLFLLSPLFLLMSGLVLAACDLCFALFGRLRSAPANLEPLNQSPVTIVIPNWNGRDLLERFLPSVLEALQGSTDNEILVVDNASTDGSVEFL